LCAAVSEPDVMSCRSKNALDLLDSVSMGYLTEERRGFLGGLFGGSGRGGAGGGGGSGGGAGSEAAARADIFLAINASTVELQVGMRDQHVACPSRSG